MKPEKKLIMKKTALSVLLLVSLNAMSQDLLDSLSNPRFTMDDSLGRRLADLAGTSVELKIIDKQIEAAKYEWQTNRASLLNNLSANFNLNENNINVSNLATNVFYPRYNFGLNLPLGNFITKPAQSKKARAQYQGTVVLKELTTRDLRQQILTAYQDYSMYRTQLLVQEEVIRDEAESFDAMQQKFRNNTITIETFTAASRKLNETLVQRITILRNVNVARYQLEALIGMRLEDALAQIRSQRRR